MSNLLSTYTQGRPGPSDDDDENDDGAGDDDEDDDVLGRLTAVVRQRDNRRPFSCLSHIVRKLTQTLKIIVIVIIVIDHNPHHHHLH